MTRTKKLAVAAALVTAFSLFAATAMAYVVWRPHVTASASSAGAHTADVQGRYGIPAHSHCEGPSGRPVLISGKQDHRFASTQTTTGAGGLYSALLGPLHDGKWKINVTVPGEVQGGYGATEVCLDASAKTSFVSH